MDEIEKTKIGKNEEKLVGWDHLRKPKLPDSNLPPMKAKNALLTPNGVRVKRCCKYTHYNRGPGLFWYIVILLVVGIIITKNFGYW